MPPLDFKLKQPGATLLVALSAAFPFTALAAAGRIDFAVGDVRALATDGRSRPLTKGATFDSGDTIETGDGRAQLRFTDGAQVSLQPGSQFRIDDYIFTGKADGSEKGLFSLLKGGLRTITGWVGRTNRDNYKVTTAVATIGIRGTEYSVNYGNSITVTTGEGIIEICNAAGCLILNSGETAYVPDGNTQPTMTDKKADVPPPPPETGTLLSASQTNEAPTSLNELPTPASEINALSGSHSYSLVSASESGPNLSTSQLTANFASGSASVSFDLYFSSGLAISGSGSNSSTGSPYFSGTGLGSGGVCSGACGCSGSFSGVFVGSNAAGANLTYSLTDYAEKTSGSASFAR
ncbi:MAG: FecR family protein [Rhodocyclaceae bacterium]|jgi:hypothetical protein|nr:FecR family protein [Rhodocyclaceae bacterium]